MNKRLKADPLLTSVTHEEKYDTSIYERREEEDYLVHTPKLSLIKIVAFEEAT